jgi:hypothetical protein
VATLFNLQNKAKKNGFAKRAAPRRRNKVERHADEGSILAALLVANPTDASKMLPSSA